MANSLSASFTKYWSRRMQRKHHKMDVFRAIASFEEEANLTKGDTVSRPYRSAVTSQAYTRGSAFSVQDLTDTEETLTVQEARVAPFYVDDLDALQHNYKVMNEYADDCAVVLGNDIDAQVLGEALNATSTIDDSDLGGTSGNGLTASQANIKKLFTIAKRKLRKQNVKWVQGEMFAVLSPEVWQILEEMLADKNSDMGDSTSMNGHVGNYMGFDLFVSNSLCATYVLALATNPTDGDTLVINGVTFTFRATLGSSAGSVHIASTVDITRANLAEFINAPSTSEAEDTDTGYVALSAANQALMQYITAANDNSANTLTLTVKGRGSIAVSETLTDATDAWTAAKQIQHQLFGKKKAIDVVVQKRPNVEVKDVPDKIGKNVVPWTLFGKKTFTEGAKQLVDVKVRADQF